MFALPAKLITAARQTAAAMTGNVASLPDCDGMVIVRCDTPEAAERLADSTVLAIPLTLDSAHYLICSR